MASGTEISAAEANRSFSRLLADVRNGKSFIVTSHGKPVAKLSPVDDQAAVDAAAEERRRQHLDELMARPVLEKPIGKWTREDLYGDLY